MINRILGTDSIIARYTAIKNNVFEFVGIALASVAIFIGFFIFFSGVFYLMWPNHYAI